MATDELRLAEWHVGPDWQIAKDDAHCLALGRLVAQLHTVEVLIRLALHEGHDSSFGGKPSVGLAAFPLLKAGDSVSVDENDYFESFAALKALVTQFNRRFPAHALREDDLIGLRDALAHGRVMPVRYKGEMVLKILKFKQPAGHPGLVQEGLSPASAEVAFAALLTPDWFLSQQSFLSEEIEKVRNAVKTLPRAK